MAGLFAKIKGRFSKKEQTLQARSPEDSTEQIADVTTDTEEERPGKLLVVGRESAFSEDVVMYALDMAQRLSYEIVALNTAPLSCETFKLFSSSRNKICEDFLALSEENARKFAQEAAQNQVPFEHVIKFSDTDHAIEEIRREKGHIDFVISEAEEDRADMRPEQGDRPQREILVYSVL